MSCYLRHLKPVLDELGIPTGTKKERKQVDLAVREVVGKSSAHQCNEVWKEVNVWLQDTDKKQSLLDSLRKLA